MDITTLLLLIAIILLLVVLFGVVKRLNEQEHMIEVLRDTESTSLKLIGELAESNKKVASTLKETMIEVKGHSEIFMKFFSKSE